MSRLNELLHADTEGIINILETADLSAVELRAALQTAFRKISLLESWRERIEDER